MVCQNLPEGSHKGCPYVVTGLCAAELRKTGPQSGDVPELDRPGGTRRVAWNRCIGRGESSPKFSPMDVDCACGEVLRMDS